MALKMISPPPVEPISVEAAKLDMRVDTDFTDHDEVIAGYISAARAYAETICRRGFVAQSWRLTLDKFPAPGLEIGSANWYGPQWGVSPGPLSVSSSEGKSGFEIVIPFAPLLSVDSIQYIDITGEQKTLAVSEYKVDKDSEPGRIVPAYDKTWPETRNEVNAVEIAFTCGYGDASAVPAGVRAAIIMYCKAHYDAAFYEVKNMEYERRMKAVDALLSPYRMLTFS